MKKIYSIAFAAVALFSAASCQKEMADPSLSNGGDFTITATTVADTKTVLDDDANVIYWTPGDKISVFDADNKEVKFSTSIMEQNTTAKFTNDTEFNAPVSLVAAYPYRGAYTFDGTVLQNFRVAGGQTAVAGSFDPEYAGAIGLPKEEGSSQLVFSNIHCLVKFTIGGEEAPTSVKLACNGMRSIAGLYHYNISTREISQGDGAKEITLTGTFKVGETYYISVIPGVVGNGLSLYFDGKEVRDTGETITLLPNKIYNLGILEVPADVEEPVVSAVDVTRVWGYYGESATAWSNSLVSSLDNNDRNLAMDDQYIYIPETNTSGNIHKFKISDGSYVGTLQIIDDLRTGTHYTSCVRMAKNTDPAINGGKDVLVVSNLALSGETLVFAAYENGTDQAPVKIWSAKNGNGRRFGDKFTIYGEYSNAKYWVRTYQGDDTMTAYAWPSNGWTWLEASRMDTSNDKGNIGEIAWYPGNNSYCMISTNSTVGAHLMSGSTEVKAYPSLAKSFGFNFFEVGDNKFVAWVSLKNGNDLPRLQIVQSDASTLDKMEETFDNLATRLVYEAPLQNANDMNTAGVGGGNTVCDCCVREINGEIYIAAMAQKAGLSVFKVTAK